MIHRDDGFGGWRAIAQCTVGAFCVVVFPAFFNQNLCFSQAVVNRPLFAGDPEVRILGLLQTRGGSVEDFTVD